MEMFDILSATKEKDDSIVLTVNAPETEQNKQHYADIRIGIHWPTSLSPACFIAVSQKYTGSHEHGKSEPPTGQRQVIAEYISESIGMNPFYRQIVEFCKQTCCSRLYAILPETRNEHGHLRDLEDYAQKAECGIYVHEANDENDFFLSVSRVRDSIDNDMLVIPENTVVFDQLSTIIREDLLDSPEERFHCIDALGNVLDGYYRWPPRNYKFTTKRRPPPDWRYH